MRLRTLLLAISSVILLILPAMGAGRPGAWRLERMPGSSRLALQSIRQIVLQENAGAELRKAADDLAMALETLYELEINIVSAEAGRPKYAIYLGDSVRGSRRLKDSAFSIYRHGTRIFIDGNDEQGVANGVYAMCSKLLGARWYWAGDLGFELIGAGDAYFPEGYWQEAPAYSMRAFYPVDTDFGRRNRLIYNFEFNHALAKVFTPELYEKEAEAFSEIKGRRWAPKGSAAYDPQPDFTEQHAVEIAAEAALAAFERGPEKQSFSLSINDNALFDESEATQALVGPVTYFRGRPNYTDLVFGFMNAVAEKVFEENGAWETPSGKPRYLSALAYYWTEQSPSFSIHPRVMPVLTSDRAQWHDPEYRAEDKALIKRWTGSGAGRIATWDYYFGAPYIYPRQFNEWIAESLNYMSGAGVAAFFSQLPSAWGLDGCKAWLAAELLWDPKQDAAKLSDEFYTHFFGAAADPMRQFYEYAEAHRNAHEGEAEWIKFYEDECAIELFDAKSLRHMRNLIESGKSLVEEDARRRARVEIVSEAFGLTEGFAQYHAARSVLVSNALAILSDSQERKPVELREQLESFLKARTDFETRSQHLLKNPMHKRLEAFTKYSKMDPAPLTLAAMTKSGMPVEEMDLPGYAEIAKAADIWSGAKSNVNSMLSNVELKHAASEPQPRNFLGPEAPEVPGWKMDFRPAQHFQISAVEAGSGIRIVGADMCSVFRDIQVASGQPYLFDARIAYRVSPDNRVRISFSWLDIEGKALGKDLFFRCPTETSEKAQRIVLPVYAPEQAYRLRVRFLISRQYEGDFLDIEQVDFGLLAGE